MRWFGERAIADCRRDRPPHAEDGDSDGIHTYRYRESCFPGVPDDGPPPSGAPLWVDIADQEEP